MVRLTVGVNMKLPIITLSHGLFTVILPTLLFLLYLTLSRTLLFFALYSLLYLFSISSSQVFNALRA